MTSTATSGWKNRDNDDMTWKYRLYLLPVGNKDVEIMGEKHNVPCALKQIFEPVHDIDGDCEPYEKWRNKGDL